MNEQTPKSVLQPVVARLREIERKCSSMGSRNEEFPQMQERLAGIIRQLESVDSDNPISYQAVARELFPVAHLFESLGFLSIGKEIAHIERALKDLEPESSSLPSVDQPSSARRPATSSAAARQPQEPEEPPPDEGTETTTDSGVPRPVLIGLLILAAACVMAASIVFRLGPFAEKPPPRPAPTAVPPTPTAAPVPEPSPTRPPLARGSNAAVRLAEEISQARLALARGDIGATLPHLSAAAIIDHDNSDVAEIAKRVVAGYISHANHAANDARWGEAGEYLESARQLAMRFNLDEGGIDEAAARHRGMVKFFMIDPGDKQSIRSASGKKVVVTLNKGDTLRGRIEGVSGSNFLLEVDKDVGGGVVRYVDDIPLSAIRSIKVFED